jgi:hypothetical protein
MAEAGAGYGETARMVLHRNEALALRRQIAGAGSRLH